MNILWSKRLTTLNGLKSTNMTILNYEQFALDNYRSPLFSDEEFNGDLNKIIVLKKMFRRYTNDRDINIRLILNNIIIIVNQFGVDAANKLLFHKVEPEHHTILKTFLVYLNSYTGTDDLIYDDIIVENLKDITCRSRL